MYKSYVYLEVRVLLSAVPGVFISRDDFVKAKDILTAKSVFLERNNTRQPVSEVHVQPAVLHKVASLVKAIGGTVCENSPLERLTANLPEPPDDRNYTGFSVKVAQGGSLDIMFHQKAKSINIEEIRIEEDCGHLTRTGGNPHVDWTYAGCPSMRLRTSASFEVGEEVQLFLQELYTLMAYLKLTTVELGENCVRCNAYAALAEYPDKPDYVVKLRNLNSFNFARCAVNSEISRQEDILSTGGTVKSESRLWIAERNTTEPWQEREPSKSKFEAVKPGVAVDIAASAGELSVGVELPAVRRERLRKSFGLSRLRAEFICGEKDRADYFEIAVAEGAVPLLTARWMAGELMKLLNSSRQSIKQCRLTAVYFASIMKMLHSEKIHSGFAKDLMHTVFETGEDPEVIVQREGMSLLSSHEEIEPFVDAVLDANEKSVQALKNGEMAPLEYLTGCVMKETQGRAVPTAVKTLIKEKLQISVIYVLTMGGAITAQKLNDGTVAAGNSETVKTLLDNTRGQFPVQVTPVRAMLSEETEPADWAKLIAEIKLRMESGTANGIVVTHGTDTLSYTAALLFWLFSSSEVPIVLTASSTLPSESDEARRNLNFAVQTASIKKRGVYVAYNSKLYSPVNLKFCNKKGEPFVNWNMEKPVFYADGGVSSQFMTVNAPEAIVMAKILNEAARELAVVHLYPGLPGFRLEKLLCDENCVDTVILELYASGTGNMRNSDYSLKQLLLKGRKNGVHFYCTSQQESPVDFSQYTTSARVWREGAVPMGIFTTETVVGLYFASKLLADSDEEFAQLMENVYFPEQ